MPLTFAHPAAVFSLYKKRPQWFDLTALIVGSMAPDFEYFMRFRALSVFGHTVAGFVYFNLPLALLAAYLWHFIVKQPLILSVPGRFGRWLAPLYFDRWRIRNVRDGITFAYSALIGMFTHILWDAFTHANGCFVSWIPLLHQSIDLFGIRVGVYAVAQQASTLLGLGIIAVLLIRASRKCEKTVPAADAPKKLGYWLCIFAVAALVLWMRMRFGLNGISLKHYGIYIVTFISGTMIGITAASVLYRALKVYGDV